MFEKLLKYYKRSSNIRLRNFERAFTNEYGRGTYMSNEEYKQLIMELIRQIEDQQILISIYTVVKNLTE